MMTTRWLSLLLLVATFVTSALAQSASRSVRDGVYNAAQAERGSALFDARCATCHGRDEFTGRFLNPWIGQTADRLLESYATSMPEDDPGSLTRQQNTDLLAFIFSRNRFPAGEKELGSTPDTLKSVVIELPPSPR